MIRVYADMVGDLFHFGHVEFLKKCRAFGDCLLVGISADENLETYKRKPILTMEERVASAAGCRFVDEVIPDAPWMMDRAFIEKHDIQIVVHGDDFPKEEMEYYYQVPIELGIFRTVPYTKGISTTEIIGRIKERLENNKEHL
ncbi:adenylyltransferase/cytidyltransferase family protein [Chloroflexota bacterium]